MNRKFLRRLLPLTIVILLLTGAVGSSTPASAANRSTGKGSPVRVGQDSGGKIVADTGFRPEANGFGFENYGSDFSAQNLLPADMRRMFGDQVCARIDGDTCDLIPPAQQFMDGVNKAMGGGHCEGMAVLSTLLYTNQEKAADFGGDTTVALSINNNEKLQREIAYWWTTQATSPSRDQIIADKTPKDILDILMKSMDDKSETYDFGIFKPGFKDGHAITPYAVQDMGGGVFHVMVYDNNWPKQERFLTIDTNTNTWSYSAATNPNEPESLYEGDASSLTLQLGPISPRLKQQNCDFCSQTATSFKVPGRAAAAVQYNMISLYSDSTANAADLLITDASGHRLGYEGGKFYHEIPDAVFDAMTSANLFTDDPEPNYFIPTGVAFTVTLDGSALKQDEVTNVEMLGPGYDLAVENIKLKAGQKDTLTFSPDGTKISYTPSSDEAPTISVGLQHAGPDYAFDIQGADVQSGASINVTLDFDKGRLGINTTGSDQKSTTYALQIDRIDSSAHDTFTHDGLALDPGETAYIEFGAWDGKGDMSISIDKTSDGTVDSTQTEPNTHK